MAISYNKLWKLLIDNHMKKKDLKEAANISAWHKGVEIISQPLYV